jgi:hypothetical protein
VLFVVVLPGIFLGIRFSRETGSAVVGIGLVVGLALLLVAIVALTRRRPAAQLAAMDQGGRFEIDAGLSFGSFPGDAARRARRSMPFAGLNQPVLPCVLTVEGDRLAIRKRTTFGTGRKPFSAEVALGDIVAVEVDRPTLVAVGSTLVLRLRDGSTVVGALSQFPEDGQRIADHLLLAISSAHARSGTGGVVVDDG